MWKIIEDAPKYEIDVDGNVRIKKTLKNMVKANRYCYELNVNGKRTLFRISDLVEKYFPEKLAERREKWKILEESPDYEINIDSVVRNKFTFKELVPHDVRHIRLPPVEGGKRILFRLPDLVEKYFPVIMEERLSKWKTLEEAPDYEINSDSIVRKKTTLNVVSIYRKYHYRLPMDSSISPEDITKADPRVLLNITTLMQKYFNIPCYLLNKREMKGGEFVIITINYSPDREVEGGE